MRTLEEIPVVSLAAGGVPLGGAKLVHLMLLGAALLLITVLVLAFLYLVRTAGRTPAVKPDRDLPQQSAEALGGSSELRCLYHPFFRSGTSKAAGCEVQLKDRPVSGDASADLFLFRTCCQWAAAQADSGLIISCRLGKDTLVREGIPEELIRLAGEAGAEHGAIMIELEQDCSEECRTSFQANAMQLKQAGFRLCLDNFGQGYTDLAGWAELVPDAVRLDGSLVRAADGAMGRAAFCGAVQLVKGTGAFVICSGIETAEQCTAAEAAGCDYLQGIYFCKPLSKEVFSRFLADRTLT